MIQPGSIPKIIPAGAIQARTAVLRLSPVAWGKWLAAGLLLLTATFFLLAEPPRALNHSAWWALGAFSVAAVLWLTHLVSPYKGSLAALLILLSFQVVSPDRIAVSLVHPVVLFLTGVFMLGAALRHAGLSETIAIQLIRRWGTTPARLSGFLFGFALVASFVVQEHLVIAVLFPIVLNIVSSIRAQNPLSAYPRHLLVVTAWGAVIGGVATYLGGGRALLANAILTDYAGISYTFWEWAAFGVPLALVTGLAGYAVIRKFFPVDLTDFSRTLAALSTEQAETEKISGGRRVLTGLILLLVLAGWLIGGHELGYEKIAITGVVLLLITGCIDAPTLIRNTNWRIILLYGGAIALGSALTETGASDWFGQTLHQLTDTLSPAALAAILAGVALVGTELMSNAATVSSFLPVALMTSEGGLISPALATLAVTFSTGFAFILPVSTPAIALILSTDEVRVRDLLLPGITIKLVAGLVLVSVLLWLQV